MNRVLFVLTLMAVNLGSGLAQQTADLRKAKAVIVAFYDENRLTSQSGGRDALDSFKFFLKPIQEIANRDFSYAEFTILPRGTLLRLPDGTGFNVQNVQPLLGFVLVASGRKRRILSGVQSDQDFACAAAAYFRRSSPACSK
jgi:hypothetical protein